MLRNYLLIAFRNAKRNKFYITVNVLGLGLGLACCLSAYLMVAFNLEFDDYFEDTSDIFRVQRTLAGEMQADGVAEIIPLPLAEAIQGSASGVVSSVRLIAQSELLRSEAGDVHREYIGYVDPNFFEMFTFEVEAGELASFPSQSSVVLSRELARKFFGDEPAVNNTLTLRLDNATEIPLTVSAVVSFPANVSFFHDAFVALPKLIAAEEHDENDWAGRFRPSVFLKLSSTQDVSQVQETLQSYVATANAGDIPYPYESFKIVPFKDPSVNEAELRRSHTNRRINPIATTIFGLLSLTILLLACFNFTNTSIALASRRLKEIGVRKVMGSMRYQLILQLMMEVAIIGVFSVGAGWLFAQYLAPAFTSTFEMGYSLQDVNLLNVSLALTLLLLLIATVAGIYPALYSTRFAPASILKGSLKLKGSNRLTRSLLTMQFALSIALLVGGFVAVKNAEYLSNLDMGYDVKQLIGLRDLEPQEVQSLMNSVRQHPKVEDFTAIRGSAIWGNYSDVVQVDTNSIDSKIYQVDANYFNTIGMDIVIGRGFDSQRASDFTESVLVNESFAAKMNWDNPINQRILFNDTARYVVGVVADVIGDLYDNEKYPSVFRQLTPNNYSRLIVRAKAEDLTTINAFLQEEWKEIAPYKPYTAEYLNQTAMGYPMREMKVFKEVLFFLALLGSLLAIAGIFSLAQINVAKRNKEIGIRKVLGASVNTIIRTLNREFVWILSISAVLGSMLGYWTIETLLGSIYAYHVQIGILPVVLAAIIIIGFAILTTSLTIRRSAQTNPVNVLRNE